VFELLASLSGRDRTGIQTEPMVVAVVGIAKRCHEIANSRQDELQARLESDGSLPKKSDFIEIMMNIWKDSMRILGKKFILTPEIESFVRIYAICVTSRDIVATHCVSLMSHL